LKRKDKLRDIEDKVLIECDSLAKAYELEGEETVVALKNITLKGKGVEGAIKKGEFVIIRGPSGGGKTTFLNVLGTIDKSTSGALCSSCIIKGSKGRRSIKLTKIRR
jgi:putative ABC transport system ATP-binding protein